MTKEVKNASKVNNSSLANTSAHETGKSFSFDHDTSVEVILINNDPWFVAADVCRALGLINTTDHITKSLDDDEHLTYKIYRAGQIRTVNMISESGLYALVVRSTKPNAKKFRKWVTSEVLPSIRKTGMYVTEKKAEQLTGHYVQVTGMNNNLYISAVMKSFREFFEEEAQGKVFTERRLNDKINAARVLFPEGKIAFRNQNVKNRMK